MQLRKVKSRSSTGSAGKCTGTVSVSAACSSTTATVSEPCSATVYTAAKPSDTAVALCRKYTAPIGENAFVKALKNIPVVFTSFFKDSKTVIKTAKAEKDIILGALFSAIFFIALILGNMFLMLSMSALDFPKTLLVSLVTAVLIGGFYSVILFAYVKKYKTEENTAKAFIDSFITFSIESIPASIGWILAGLSALISVYMFLFFFVIVMLYLVISLVNQVKANVPEAKNSALFTLILTLIVAVAFMIIFFIGAKLTMWSFNTGTFTTSVLTSLIGGGSYPSWY